MSFGKNLESLRKQKGWSQDKLAEKLNLSRQAISKWENETNKPDIDNVKSISKLFAIRIDDLLDNELPEKAAKIDVRKAEKKEAISKIVKYMVIAIILLYLISVIYKFASLLIIVNGVQKYANLDNYYYRITTYDESGLVEKEECWFKDGESKTVCDTKDGQTITCIDYIKNIGYVLFPNQEKRKDLNMNEYNFAHLNYKNGGQIFDMLPKIITEDNLMNIFINAIDLQTNIKIYYDGVVFQTRNKYIIISKNDLLPKLMHSFDDNNTKFFTIKINYVGKINL